MVYCTKLRVYIILIVTIIIGNYIIIAYRGYSDFKARGGRLYMPDNYQSEQFTKIRAGMCGKTRALL